MSGRDVPPVPAQAAPPGSRRFGIAVAVGVVLVTLALGAVLVGAQLPGDGLPQQPAGSSAPDFVLPALDGGSVALGDLGDGPVLLTFWASWCSSCKSDMPALARLARTWEARGVRVLGVVIEDTRAAAMAVVEEYELPYDNVLDVEDAVATAYTVTGTPETFLIDTDGRVVAKWIGPLPVHDVEFQLGLLAG